MKPKRVVVEVTDRVAPTLARSFPECEVVPTRQDTKLQWVRKLDDVDCFSMIADLPGLVRRRREDFPTHTGYFKADPARVAHWRAQLDAAHPGPRPRHRHHLAWRCGTDAQKACGRCL
ncbi:MAG: hypothetical protein HC793_00850 [Aquincola sp.]|nr:hypothetical protein [Aquincola sp.]